MNGDTYANYCGGKKVPMNLRSQDVMFMMEILQQILEWGVVSYACHLVSRTEPIKVLQK